MALFVDWYPTLFQRGHFDRHGGRTQAVPNATRQIFPTR